MRVPRGPESFSNGATCVTGTVLTMGAAACADGGGNSLCPGLALVPDASCTEVSPSDPTACNLIIHCPEAIAACSFVATPADAGVDTAVEAATDAGDAATE